MSLSAAERSLRASLAAHELHAQRDSIELTANGRARFLQGFYEKTDPRLPHRERLRRAEHLLRAHMKRLALASAKARKKDR
jgi:hypothetical protein